MITGMFTMWTGHPVEEIPRGRRPRRISDAASPRLSDPEIVYAMRPGTGQTVAVSVVSAEICARKSVDRCGRSRLELDRGVDRVVMCAERETVVVTRGDETVTLNLSSTFEDDLVRLRTMLVASPAVRAFRPLATAVDETESDTAERLAVRLSGRLLAQFDGDHGAVRRLSRELHDRYAPQLKRGRRQVPLDWDMYQTDVVRACAELHVGLGGLSYWSPLRQVRSMAWITQVEAAWYAYVASALASRARQ